jgi:hypothetical protein
VILVLGLTFPLFALLFAFVVAGFIFTTVFGVAMVVGLAINLALLPLRIFFWIIRAIFGFL